MVSPFFQEEFPSSLDAMGEALMRALASLQDGDWIEPDQAFYARLCLEEALLNAIMHGNRWDATRRVRLEMFGEGDICRIRVKDEGPGFSPDAVALPESDQEGGRGICLIRYCMEEVHFDPVERCLEMKMRRKGLCRGGVRP